MADPSKHAGTAIAVAVVVGSARMYAGAHLPLDVAGGTAIGMLCGRAANVLLNSPIARPQS